LTLCLPRLTLCLLILFRGSSYSDDQMLLLLDRVLTRASGLDLQRSITVVDRSRFGDALFLSASNGPHAFSITLLTEISALLASRRDASEGASRCESSEQYRMCTVDPSRHKWSNMLGIQARGRLSPAGLSSLHFGP